MKQINDDVFNQLLLIGVIDSEGNVPENRQINIGTSDYSNFLIQPWSYIQDHNMDYLHGDIIKRITRCKPGTEKEDLFKIKHICDEIIRRIDAKNSIEFNQINLNDNED